MIRVTVWKSAEANPFRIRIEGHALFAPYGQDIVCAAVSVLAQTTALALGKLAKCKPFIKKSRAYLLIQLPDDVANRSDVRIIMKTLILGLQEITKNYPVSIMVKKRRLATKE